MIPDFVDIGAPAPWPVLPPGLHDATLDEARLRFATTPHRRRLFEGFSRATDSLRQAGCATVYLDGSYVTGKPHPGDFDGCWDLAGVNPGLLDPVLLDFSGKREAQKAKYFGEMFAIQLPHQPGLLSFFQKEKFSDRAKGIVRITLVPLQGATP